jgi:hypothetical protein|tara:strand:- start:69 stop:278 length:210 start_codon:yes stop_codon:yes gene_type:complete
MNIKRLLKSFLIVITLAGIFVALLFLLKGLVLMFPIFFEYVGITILILMVSSPFVAVTYTILKKLEKNK